MSKGCGYVSLKDKSDPRIVEYSNRDEAQHAIQTLSNTTFMGRQVFVREVCLAILVADGQDREQEPRFGGGHRGGFNAGGYGGYPRGGFQGGGQGHNIDVSGRQVYVGNVLRTLSF